MNYELYKQEILAEAVDTPFVARIRLVVRVDGASAYRRGPTFEERRISPRDMSWGDGPEYIDLDSSETEALLLAIKKAKAAKLRERGLDG